MLRFSLLEGGQSSGCCPRHRQVPRVAFVGLNLTAGSVDDNSMKVELWSGDGRSGSIPVPFGARSHGGSLNLQCFKVRSEGRSNLPSVAKEVSCVIFAQIVTAATQADVTN